MLVFVCGMLVYLILWNSETLKYKEVQFDNSKSKTYSELSKKAHSDNSIFCRSTLVVLIPHAEAALWQVAFYFVQAK